MLRQQLALPGWLNRMAAVDLGGLTVACTPPYGLKPVAGRLWLYSMTEGSDLPHGWLEHIEDCNVERVIVPCQHNADAFARCGVTVPIHVVPGGTDPAEFPLLDRKRRQEVGRIPYTFLALADRGGRKEWMEVWQAFLQSVWHSG